jgi:hypothetical protein
MSFSILARFAAPVVIALAGYAPPANADGGTVVPMGSKLRACDFSPISDRASQDDGTVSAVIHTGGGSVTADVHFVEPGTPNARFDVALIQAPRPSNSLCDGPGPGVAIGSLNLNGAGVGDTTVSDSLHSGTTGVWVFVRRPSPYSQSPTEFYTSDVIAKV